jgi:transcriptional regulator with XRE-family HTH domain
MTLRAVLAANLRTLRAEKKLSQEQLADLAGVARNYIGMLEREENAASVDVLEQIAAALSVPASSLLEKHESGGSSDEVHRAARARLDRHIARRLYVNQ